MPYNKTTNISLSPKFILTRSAHKCLLALKAMRLGLFMFIHVHSCSFMFIHAHSCSLAVFVLFLELSVGIYCNESTSIFLTIMQALLTNSNYK